MSKIEKGGENRCQNKETNNIIKLEKQIKYKCELFIANSDKFYKVLATGT